MYDVAGPAYLLAWKTFKVTAFMWVLTPLITYKTSRCEDTSAIASVPNWIVLPFFGFLLYLLSLELRTFRYVIVVYAEQLAQKTGLKALGCICLYFEMWLAFQFAITAFAHADIITSGISMAKIIKSETCNVEGN